MQSAIQLLEHKFTLIELHPAPSGDPTGSQSGSHAVLVQPFDEELKIWNVRLRIELLNAEEGNPAPYCGTFEVVGRFQLTEDFPKEQENDMLHLSGGAILYGALRELILNLTARSLHGEATIPTIDARSFIPKKEDAAIDK